jgi:hypothetical protein
MSHSKRILVGAVFGAAVTLLPALSARADSYDGYVCSLKHSISGVYTSGSELVVTITSKPGCTGSFLGQPRVHSTGDNVCPFGTRVSETRFATVLRSLEQAMANNHRVYIGTKLALQYGLQCVSDYSLTK